MALSKALKAKLAKAKGDWNKAKTRATQEGPGGIEDIDDGRYIARLTSAEVGESKSSGRLQVGWTYQIAEGDYKGRRKMSFDGMETEQNLVYLAKNINRYGYECPDDLEQIEALLQEIVKEKPLVRIRLKTRGEFQNVYIDQVFDKDDEDEVLQDAASDVDEETEEVTEEVEEADEVEETDGEEDETETEDEDGSEESDEEESDGDDETADDDEVVIEAGMRVLVNGKPGEIVEVLEDEGKVRVKMDGTGKVVRTGADALELIEDTGDAGDEVEEDEEEEEVPETPKKGAKKPAPAPAKPAAPAKGKPGKKK